MHSWIVDCFPLCSLLAGAFISGLIGMAIGSLKGSPGLGCVLGFVLGPIGWFIIAVSPDIRPKCPYCKGAIVPGAIKCQNCGSTIPRCPGCNKIIRTEAAACKNCGHSLNDKDPRGKQVTVDAAPAVTRLEPPAEIYFACPGCQKWIRAKVQMMGHPARCSGCGSSFVVPNSR